jgi:hypothetical protein
MVNPSRIPLSTEHKQPRQALLRTKRTNLEAEVRAL